MIKLELPDSVSSSQDLAALTLEVRDYAKWFSHNAIKKRVHAKHNSPAPDLSHAASEMIESWRAKKPLTTSSLDDLIKALEKYKDTAPTLTITLAAPPTKDIKQTLVSWCRKNIKPNILVSFQFDATLLGGMVVRYGSHIFDWSFRRQLLAARERFPEVLRSV